MNPTQQSNLELLPAVTFSAGETKVFYLSGSYFELIDCANAVDVLLTDRSGGQRARMIGAAQTHHVKNTPYEVVQITSASAQTIRFAYGSGEAGTRNTAGSVSVLNAVDISAASLAALESTDINAASLAAMKQPLQSTGNFKSNSALAAATPETVFTAAANVAGAIVLTAGYTIYGNATWTWAVFIAKATAPASVTDGEVLCSPLVQNIASTNYTESGQIPGAQYLPPGVGLYFITSGAALGGVRHARYRLL